jgi:mRNA interferase YafO
VRQHDRKSDNFLIYAQHWDCRDFYQIVAILSPDAHATVDGILPALIDHVEDEFQSFNERELKELLNVSS